MGGYTSLLLLLLLVLFSKKGNWVLDILRDLSKINWPFHGKARFQSWDFWNLRGNNVREKGRNEGKQSHNEGQGDALEWQSGKGRKTLCCVSNSIPFVLREAWEVDRQLPSSDKWSVINVCFSFLYKCEVISKISPVQLLKSPSSQTLPTGNSHGHPDVSLHSVCLCSVYIYLFLVEWWLHEMLYYGDWSFAQKYWEGEQRDAWVQGDTWPLSRWSISENFLRAALSANAQSKEILQIHDSAETVSLLYAEN